MKFLNDLPLGSIIAVVGIVLIAFGYVTDDISINDAFQYLAYVGGSSAAIGIMRTHAGKGIK